MNKTTQPIRSRKKVNEFLVYLRGKNYRDYVLAKFQLNTARRISDIVNLKASDVMEPTGIIKKHLVITEKKTGKKAIIGLNDELVETIKDYTRSKNLGYNDYLFQSRKGYNSPITTTQAYRIFCDAAQALQIQNFGTHSLRKTWGYFSYKESKDIATIMEVYNHSSEKVTLRYIGITQKEMDVLYMKTKF